MRIPLGYARKSRFWLIVCLALASLAGPLVSAAQRSNPTRNLPAFQFTLIDGSVIKSEDLKGKVAVIDFWGTWCGPCIQEIPSYNQLYTEKKGRGMVLLGLAVDSGTEAEVRSAAKKLSIGYPVAAPKLKDLDIFGDIGVIPTTWVIDREGNVAKVFEGESAEKRRVLRETVDRLLK
jgi:thiol-disulfide isomerase/thioredoxin